MPRRHPCTLFLLLVALALLAAPALAAKPAPTPMTVSGGTVDFSLGNRDPHPAACEIGTTGPPANAYGYILPPDDAYATLIDPSQCGACPNNRFVLTVAHVQLFFTESCQIPVSVYVVPAYDQGGGCLAPDWSSPPVCQPAQYLLDDGGVLNTCLDYGLALQTDCCIDRPMFLVFEFDQGSCRNGRPAFCGPAACNNCTQYNYYPGATAPGDDLCSYLAQFGLTGNVMYAEADCCTPTSARIHSWGRVKTLYR